MATWKERRDGGMKPYVIHTRDLKIYFSNVLRVKMQSKDKMTEENGEFFFTIQDQTVNPLEEFSVLPGFSLQA